MGSIPTFPRQKPEQVQDLSDGSGGLTLNESAYAEHTAAVLILNPVAGRGAAGRHESDAVKALEQAGLAVDLRETEAPGHATEIAREAASQGARIIVAGGGDGTVHETALGMWESGAALGVLPLGSGNDFARSHRIPKDLDAAARIIRSGRTAASDIGRFGEWFFFNTMGIGFTVDVTLRSRKITWLRGLPLYLLAVFKSLAGYRSGNMRVESDGFLHDAPTYFITTAIGICEGGGFMLTPDASWDDGLLDVCLVDAITVPTALRVLPRAMKGSHTTHPAVTMLRTAALRMENEHLIVAHADGQVYETGCHALEVSCLPGALDVRVPAG